MKARGLRRDKTRFPSLLRIHLLNDSHRFTGYVVMVQDMSEQVKIRKTQQQQMIRDIEAYAARFSEDSQSNLSDVISSLREICHTTVKEFYQICP